MALGRADREFTAAPIPKDPSVDAASASRVRLSSGESFVGRDRLPSGEGLSSRSKETLIVFDWDDTILPTSWLQRVHNLSGGMLLTHESQALIANLAEVCIQTLMMACSMGTVIIITNSVPGWVDQSSQLFMPQMTEFMKRFNIIARPMRAPLTFKTSAFQREFRTFRNLISIGDGNAERTASLRLQTAPDLVCMSSLSGKDAKEAPRNVKSVKLIEMPTCQQLHAQQEMLQQRLADIVGFRGHLDLKSRFSSGSLGLIQTMNKVGSCNLVHFAKPSVGLAMGGGGMGGFAAWSAQEGQEKPTAPGGPRAKTPALAGPGGTGSVASLPERAGPGLHPSPSTPGLARPSGRQLPLLGGLGGASSGKSTPEPCGILERLGGDERGDRLSVSAGGVQEMDGGTAAADSLLQAMGGMGSASAVDMAEESSETGMQRSASAAEERLDGTHGSSTGSMDVRKNTSTPLLTGNGLWKVQSLGERGQPRAGAVGIAKKRPSVLPLSPSLAAGARSPGAGWRENSAPAALRSF